MNDRTNYGSILPEEARSLAVLIGSLFRFQERNTVSSDPDGWIEKYLEGEAETDTGRPVKETITTHTKYTTHTTLETGEANADPSVCLCIVAKRCSK